MKEKEKKQDRNKHIGICVWVQFIKMRDGFVKEKTK